MTHVRGEFVIFLDTDDTIHPGKFIHDMNILRTHPEVAAVVGRALYGGRTATGMAIRMPISIRYLSR